MRLTSPILSEVSRWLDCLNNTESATTSVSISERVEVFDGPELIGYFVHSGVDGYSFEILEEER